MEETEGRVENKTVHLLRTRTFGSHSMTHQALIPSTPSSAFSPASHFLHASSASLSSSPSLSSHRSFAAAAVMSSFAHPHHASSLVEKDGRMSALRSILRPPYEAAEEMAAAAAAGTVAWGAAERGGGDGFSVEDLLDLEELCEVDKDSAGEHVEATPVVEKEKSSDSHGSSVVSYEPMPLLPPVMDLPAHDVEELEWVSRIMDDSLAELPVPQLPAAAALVACNKSKPQHRRLPQDGALVPVRTPTICLLSTEALVPVKSKKRSKRSRASVWSLSGAPMSDSASSSSTATTSSCSSSASFSSFLQFVDFPSLVASDLLDEHQRSGSKKSKHDKNGGGKQKPKKRGRKPKHHQPPHLAGGGGALVPAPSDRRCSHCGSGRLLPEYRPACSPTYVSSLHSNSHRKVLEMRRKKENVVVAVAAAAPAVASF
uniref:GATA-type domain-containing protein n=1 Tax=Leersia perrieri TaxID=77586 RepID=A0A0D9VIV7_9ORYZ